MDLPVASDELTYADLYTALEEASSRIGRGVNPTILTTAALTKKVQAKEAFITRVLAQPKIWICGEQSVIAP